MKTVWIMTDSCSENIFGFNHQPNDHRPIIEHERMIGPSNFKQVGWLESALSASRKVCRIRSSGGTSTGFLVGPDLLITNHHVFKEKHDAANATLEFDYRLHLDGSHSTPDVWHCDPESFFHTNPFLDYTIVKVKPRESQIIGDKRGYFEPNEQSSIRANQRVNIIQHPQGRFQEIAFRDNQIHSISEHSIQYLTDTDSGSSGAPVLDDQFKLVAIHSQGIKYPQSPYSWFCNQGYRMDSIYKDYSQLIKN